MKTTLTQSITLIFSAIAILAASGFAYQDQTGESQSKPKINPLANEEIEFAPVDDMHHFMEYISRPSYKAFKDGMATAPANRKEWKPIKINALISGGIKRPGRESRSGRS